MRRKGWTRLDGFSDRLMHSRNPEESRSIYQGIVQPHGFPFLLDTDLLFEHKHIVGPPGTGKTSIGLLTDILQLIRRGDGPVVVFDCKGDRGLFHAVLAAARKAGRKVKWFTNRPNRSSYVFNPWDRRLLATLSLPDILGLYMQSLNMHHGEDYGRGWFSLLTRTLLRRGIIETMPTTGKNNKRRNKGQGRLFPKYGPIRSFHDLRAVLEEVADDNEELRGAKHLAFLVESLCDFEQLNLAANRDPNHPALQHAICMPEVIQEKQVIYFYLVGAMDVASVAEIAKLALYSLLMAAIDYYDRHGDPPRIYTFWDEAQVMIAKNIENVLAMARSNGLACVLSHQSISQLAPAGGPDLRDLVITCQATKQIFGAREPWLLKYISSTSGSTKYYRQGYNLTLQDATSGNFSVHQACADRDGVARVSIQEYAGPRLTYQDILGYSQDPNLSLIWVPRFSGLTRFRGWVPISTGWPMTRAAHDKQRRQAWPETTDETMEMESNWPDENEHTITASTHPELAPSPEEVSASSRLKAIRQQIMET